MVSVHNISKSFGTQLVFDGVSFSINPGERVGVVGRNGHGKTTLFRLLTGEEECEGGTVAVSRGYKIGYLQQHLTFTAPTVLAEACLGLLPERKDREWEVKKALVGLGFTEADYDRDPSEFSGGYQVRLNLAKVLAGAPDMLLLDEPTNFLDIVSIRWMIRFLKQWQGEAMIISHDRGFMDSVVTHILGIHRCAVRKVAGHTEQYYSQIAQEEDIHEKQRQNVERKQKQLEQFITRFRAKARHASLAQSRAKTLDKLDVPEKLSGIEDLSFRFEAAPFEAKHAADVQNLTFSYTGEEPWLVRDFSLGVAAHDRVCIIGKNGRGKTTLLKLIAGELTPGEGAVKFHSRVLKTYYEQGGVDRLHDELSIEDEIALSHPTGDRQRVRNICGGMLFSGDTALKRIKVLSGGEKCRVLLGKMLVAPSNLLLLDEPTHHLDMPSCEALIDAVNGFSGAAVIVSHDEHLLRSVATRLVVFSNDRMFHFPGTYDEFLQQVGWEGEEQPAAPARSGGAAADKKKVSRKEQRKARADQQVKRSRVLNPLKKRVDEVEKKIERTETELAEANEKLAAAAQEGDQEIMAELSKTVNLLPDKIDRYYYELEVATELYEEKKVELDGED